MSIINYFFLYLTRWTIVIFLLPFLAGRAAPSIFKLALASLMAFLSVMVNVNPQNILLQGNLSFSILFINEVCAAFIFGFLLTLFFYMYEAAGRLMDVSRAANMSNQLILETKESSSVLGSLLFQLCVLLFFYFGLHRPALKVLLTYNANINVFANSSEYISDSLSWYFKTAVQISLGVIFVGLVVDIIFGLLNRASPQINAYFLSLPLKLVAGLMVFLVLLNSICDELSNFFMYLFNLVQSLQ